MLVGRAVALLHHSAVTKTATSALTDEQRADADRLKSLFKTHARLSQQQFGLTYEVGSQSMVWQYLNGHRPLNAKAAAAFARGLGVPVSDFSPSIAQQIDALADASLPAPIPEKSATASGSQLQHPSLLGVRAWDRAEDLYGDDVPIRRAAVRLHGGPGRLQFEALEKPALPFQRSWLESMGIRPDGAWLLSVEGDSMEEMYCDGDLVLVDTHDKVIVDGRAYAIAHADGYRIKYLLKRTDGGLTIHSHNSAKYPDEIIAPDAAQELVIIGRVKWRAG